MAKTPEALITPSVLAWARASAGYDVVSAAKRVPVSPERLSTWESGESLPTVAQLRKLANLYKRPMATFYLPAPPMDFQALRDFRRFSGAVAAAESPALRYEIRLAELRREIAADLSADLEWDTPVYDVHVSFPSDSEETARTIRGALGVAPETQRAWAAGYDAFNGWRAAVEAAGVLVFQMTDVELAEARGFSVPDLPLPAVAVNIKDALAGRIFTMMHELVHLSLRQGGLCDLQEGDQRPPEEQAIEVFCNRVAGAILLPEQSLLNQPAVRRQTGSEWSDGDIQAVSRDFGVSREVLVRRLLVLGRTTDDFYQRKRAQFHAELEVIRSRPIEGFAPPHRMALSTAGRTFTGLVLAAYGDDRVTAGDVAEYLGVRFKHVPLIEAELGRRGPRRASGQAV